MIERAIINAQYHGINLCPSKKIPGDGDCVFNSILDNINSRSCFVEHYKNDAKYWIPIWMTELENIAFDTWNGSMSRAEWKFAFMKLKQPGTYRVPLGDLMIPGVAHSKKRIF